MYVKRPAKVNVRPVTRGGIICKNLFMGCLSIFFVVNLCTTKNIAATVYDTEEGVLKVMNPVFGEYIDTNYLGEVVHENTNALLNLPLIGDLVKAYDASGAADGMSKLFAPLVNKYGDGDISGILASYGMFFDESIGEYIVSNNETESAGEVEEIEETEQGDTEDGSSKTEDDGVWDEVSDADGMEDVWGEAE